MCFFMKAREMRAVVEWAPRECNREADLLDNGITDLFDPKRRMQVTADVSMERPSRGALSREGDSRATQ